MFGEFAEAETKNFTRQILGRIQWFCHLNRIPYLRLIGRPYILLLYVRRSGRLPDSRIQSSEAQYWGDFFRLTRPPTANRATNSLLKHIALILEIPFVREFPLYLSLEIFKRHNLCPETSLQWRNNDFGALFIIF